MASVSSSISPVSISTTAANQVDSKTQRFIGRLSKAKSIEDLEYRIGALLNLADEMIEAKVDQKLIGKVFEEALEVNLAVKGLEFEGRRCLGDAKRWQLNSIFLTIRDAKLSDNILEKLCKKGFEVVRTIGVDEQHGYADDKMEALMVIARTKIHNNIISKELFAEAIEIAKTLEGYAHDYDMGMSGVFLGKIDCMEMSCRFISKIMVEQGFNEREITHIFKNKGVEIELKNTELRWPGDHGLFDSSEKEVANLTIKMNTDPVHLEHLRRGRVRRLIINMHFPKEKERKLLEIFKDK